MKTRILLTTLLLSCLTAFLLSTSCRKKKVEIDPAFGQYISAFTSGVISKTSAIRIELTQDVSGVELNAEIEKKLFDFSPSIKGKAYWISANAIEFRPDEELKPGKNYTAEFKLGKVLEVPDHFKVFTFDFQVIEPAFKLTLLPYTPYADDNLEWNYVEGTIETSDVASAADVSAMLSAQQNNNPLTITWGATEGNTLFRFTIDSIQRVEASGKVEVRVEGDKIGADQLADEEIKIPSLSSFEVLDVSANQTAEPYLVASFSDPLLLSQDLTGLITLGETECSFAIDRNKVTIYPSSRLTGTIDVTLNEGIRNAAGKPLGKTSLFQVVIEEQKPAVRLVHKGTILPETDGLQIPFQTVNLRAVDIRIIKIFENNVLQFMQTNELDGQNELKRVGRPITRKTIRLDDDKSLNLHKWNTFRLKLDELIEQEPGAIYRIEFNFKRSYSLYPCGDSPTSGLATLSDEENQPEDLSSWDNPSSYYYYDDEYYDDEYQWNERDNPCSASYFYNRKVACNVLASNLGILVKGTPSNNYQVVVTNLLTTEPEKNVEVELFNFQRQSLGKVTTDNNGMATLQTKSKPFIAVAVKDKQRGYLKLDDGSSLSLSRFDVGGKQLSKGLKGYIYGERGVWRPGDTVFLTFVLQDKAKTLPADHPVVMELYNPQGQFVRKMVQKQTEHQFYPFRFTTEASAPTGNWQCYVKVGGAVFSKSLRIETIKPNRLKVNLELPATLIDASSQSVSGTLHSQWLHGAPARELKADVNLKLVPGTTHFTGYDNYVFEAPYTSFEPVEQEIFNGRLNDQGDVNITATLPVVKNAPGMLRANLVSKVYEPGGDASVQVQNIPYSPYPAYVGINFQKNERESAWFATDTAHRFEVVTLNAQGKPVNRNDLDFKVYKLDWRWWWDEGSDDLSVYVDQIGKRAVSSQTLRTVNGKTSVKFRVNYPEWGRYLVYVKDRIGGHVSGKIIYVDWPMWRGRSQKSDPSGLTMLSFSTDKKIYKPGEEAVVMLPKNTGGRALVSIENGSRIITSWWETLKEGSDARITFKITPDMTPNCYVHVTLIQPHKQVSNDLPLRMYGVVPIEVQDPGTVLSPRIKLPEVLRPAQPFTVEVSETSGQAMTYTLALVDEGLLDLTSFKTPNPRDEFFAREALGIKTWDLFDWVIGSFSGQMGPLFSIGGDGELQAGSKNQANRFKPVVKYLGPFTLSKNKTDKHHILLPMYVGSVRVMLVAGNGHAYGSTEKAVPVRNPLMVLSTLPRVAGPGEELVLPVNVFALEKKVKNVTVKIKTGGLLAIEGTSVQQATFRSTGDKTVFFRLKAQPRTGIEKVSISASGNGEQATDEIEIEVRNPNPPLTTYKEMVVEAGKSGTLEFEGLGSSPDDWNSLELSGIPPVDLSRSLDYLIGYPHGCAEQTISKAFPQLFLDEFMDLTKAHKEEINTFVTEAIKKLYGLQLADGSFTYWPGMGDASEWVTSYAGQFLVEARAKGYSVNEQTIDKWKRYQKRAAQNWTEQTRLNSPYRYYMSDLQQAYRLYTLALADAAEISAMNRLKELKTLSVQARWRLAAAYALAGKKEAARQLTAGASTQLSVYTAFNATFGSMERDEAMILETLLLTDQLPQAQTVARKVSQSLSGNNAYSTQSTAHALLAMARFARLGGKTGIDARYTVAGKSVQVKSGLPVYQVYLNKALHSGQVLINNQSKGILFTRLVTRTRPLHDASPASANNLKLDVAFTNSNGSPIDVSRLKQGNELSVTVTVTNPSAANDITDMALTQIMPSGWEIANERMLDQSDSPLVSRSNYTYRDYRDDRVLTYFNLKAGESKTFTLQLQAAYAGRFYLPAVMCEAMYDASTFARTTGQWVEVEP